MQTLDLTAITLHGGSHDSPDEGHCLLEVVSMFAGEEFGDSPACVCPVLAAFGRSWNDGMRSDAEREQLKQYIPLLLNTRADKATEERRAFMAMDWLIREYTPVWLDLNASLKTHAAALRAHPQITSVDGLLTVLPIAVAAQKDVNAAWDAAWDAAWAAAWDAARDATRAAARAAAWAAARDAARAAAGDAARDAAWDAAWGAAGAAAGAAAGGALSPTVFQLQDSAHRLFRQMIEA